MSCEQVPVNPEDPHRVFSRFMLGFIRHMQFENPWGKDLLFLIRKPLRFHLT